MALRGRKLALAAPLAASLAACLAGATWRPAPVRKRPEGCSSLRGLFRRTGGLLLRLGLGLESGQRPSSIELLSRITPALALSHFSICCVTFRVWLRLLRAPCGPSCPVGPTWWASKVTATFELENGRRTPRRAPAPIPCGIAQVSDRKRDRATNREVASN